MSKLKVLISTLLVLFAGSSAYGQDSPLKVEIKPVQTVVKNNVDFSVATAIRNTGEDEQGLEVVLCCYEALWMSDNPTVQVGCAESCAKNSSIKFLLKPGRAYEKEILVRVVLPDRNSESKLVTFRLGFRTLTHMTAQKALPIWSNAVTVSITR